MESEDALSQLGLKPASVVRLRMPDGGVRRAESYGADITAAVMRILAQNAERGPAWCIAPWTGDGHPDHAAAGAAAITAAGSTARLLAYPVWMWHWAEPDDPRVPWWQARRIVLPDDVRDAKRAAAAAFTTQVNALSEDPADAASCRRTCSRAHPRRRVRLRARLALRRRLSRWRAARRCAARTKSRSASRRGWSRPCPWR